MLPQWRSIAAIVALVASAGAINYEPQSEIGYPAGLIPECPGVMKNVTISAGKLPQLRVVLHRVDRGQVYRRILSVMTAPRILAKDKYVDFRNRKTVVYLVGYLDSSLFPHSQAIGSAYAKRGYNVLITETFTLLNRIFPISVRLTRAIGTKIGEMLIKLRAYGLTSENLEIVGVSLGAHIGSYASKHWYSITGEKISRLTGLDPAGPCYRSLPPHMRFHKDDAVLTDVLHTNIDGFGMAEPMAHVDFYANGGEYQPSDIPYIPCLVICSHLRSIIYWWQAMEHPKKFVSVQCNSVQDARFANCFNSTVTNYLGSETKFDRPGLFYLPTNNEFPYYRGKEGLKAENEIYTSVIRTINSDDGDLVI